MPTTALAGDIRGSIRRGNVIGGVVSKGGGFNATARALAAIVNENAESWLSAIIEAGKGCDVILVAGLTAFLGFSAAEYLGAKSIGSGMIPITPATAFPSPFLPPKWVPRFLQSREPPLRELHAMESFPRQDQRGACEVQTAGAQSSLDRTAPWPMRVA